MIGQDQRLVDLLARIGGNEDRAMTELLEWTRPFLISFIRKYVRDPWTTEEILQDVYRQVWFQAPNYTRDRGTPSGWIYMIARSRAFDSLRHQQTDRSLPMLEGEEQRIPGPYDEDAYVNLRHHATVRNTLVALPESQRHMIQLAFYEGYSHTEIADQTGVPLGTVKTRIRKGLSQMREMLTGAQLAA